MRRVLAIVVLWNAMPWLGKCLGSLRESTLRPDVLAIDNGSSDGTPECVRSDFPWVRLISNPEGNTGFGAANNIGLSLALRGGYDYIYLLNQDAWVESDTIEKLVLSFPSGYGILSPVQNDAKGELDANFKNKCSRFLIGGGEEVSEVPFVMAAHWLISRSAVEVVGGFSPAFSQYGEDDNYIHRLHYYGLKCGVLRSAKAVHDRAGRSVGKDKRMRLKCISQVVRLSDPGRNFTLQKVLSPLALAGMALKNFSVVPLRFIPTLLHRYPELKRLREVSMSYPKAFL